MLIVSGCVAIVVCDSSRIKKKASRSHACLNGVRVLMVEYADVMTRYLVTWCSMAFDGMPRYDVR